MPLSIADYKNWARQDQATTVSLTRDSGGLMAEKDRLGFLARTFGGSLKTVRTAVIKDFTRALSARYGASIAQQAVAIAGLSPTTKLKGWKITEAIQAAKTLRGQMLLAGGAAPDLRLGDLNVPGEATGIFLTDKANPVAKFLKQRTVAVQLLGEMPLDTADYADFHARAESLVNRLLALRDAEVPEGIPAEDFRRAVDGLVGAVREKDLAADRLLSGRPLAETNIRDYKEVWRSAALNALNAMLDAATLKEDIPTASVIDRAIRLLDSDDRTRADFHARVALSKNVESKRIKPFLVDLLARAKRQLAQEHVNVRRARIDTDGLVRNLKAGFRKALNERPWTTVAKTLSVSVGGRPVELRSTIAPAEQLGRSEQAPRGPIAGTYPDGVHGYMCHSADSNHAVNLSVSSLTVAEPGGPARNAFSGVRHGVHCAWEVRNADERAAANANRAKEAVIAAFLAKFGGEGGVPEPLPAPDGNGTIAVDLRMTSVSLLTPDPIRHKTKRNSSSDERRMLREQTEAWEAVERTGVTLRFGGREITVRPRIRKFNFGVNEGAVKFAFPFNLATGGWLVSGPMNNAAFAALAQDAETFIQAHPGDPKATAARTLLDQCRTIFRTRGERSDSHDAYKFAARVAVLSHLIGDVPCWNCKSGKDRTGEMDVECKFLSTLIARGEPIPAPGARLTKAQTELFRSIALEGGNFEIQKMNTGVAGFKTGGVNSITERLGGQAYRDLHRGGSDHVGV